MKHLVIVETNHATQTRSAGSSGAAPKVARNRAKASWTRSSASIRALQRLLAQLNIHGCFWFSITSRSPGGMADPLSKHRARECGPPGAPGAGPCPG